MLVTVGWIDSFFSKESDSVGNNKKAIPWNTGIA
jgi:hypothetical protein